jgi:hypothetical protein
MMYVYIIFEAISGSSLVPGTEASRRNFLGLQNSSKPIT